MTEKVGKVVFFAYFLSKCVVFVPKLRCLRHYTKGGGGKSDFFFFFCEIRRNRRNAVRTQ